MQWLHLILSSTFSHGLLLHNRFLLFAKVLLIEEFLWIKTKYMMNTLFRCAGIYYKCTFKNIYLLPELIIIPLSGKFVLILCPLEVIQKIIYDTRS